MTSTRLRMVLSALCMGIIGGSAVAEAAPATASPINPPLYHVSIGKSGGIPLIAVNGGPGFGHDYLTDAPVWKAMAEQRTIIFYDQRGTGRSPKASRASDLTVAGMVEDLEGLRRELKVDRIDLLGHSWGGILSLAYAVRYPQHVAHIVVVGSGDPKPAEHEFLFDKLYPELMATIPNDPSPAGQMGCVTLDAYEKMSYYDQRNRLPEKPNAGGGFSSEVCTAVMLDAMKLDLYPALRQLKVPTLVTNGRFDANVAPTVAYKISRAISGSKLVYFERSGHSPFIEEPGRFKIEIERFLDSKN